MSIEDIYTGVKNDNNNKKKFVDLYQIDPDVTIDPLRKVVPTSEDEMFGTYTLHFLVFTKIYLNDDFGWDAQYSDSKARLKVTYKKFAKYGLYVYIDGSTSEIQNADSGDLETFKQLLSDMANELSDYGVVYGGQLEEAELKTNVEQVISDFFN